MYPVTEGATFDHDYYRDHHVPLAVRTWGLDGAEIDKGIDGPYVAAVHFRFESIEAMNAARAVEGSAADRPPTSPTTRPSSRSVRSARSSDLPK